MSFLYPMELRMSSMACYNSLDGNEGAHFVFSHTSPHLLWGNDPYLSAKLLSSISGEAHNRKLSATLVYDPLLPNNLSALGVQGIGAFTSDLRTITSMTGLIDCTPLSQGQMADPISVSSLCEAKQTLLAKITAISRLLADQIALRKTACAKIIDIAALTKRASGIARRMPRGEGNILRLPILSYGDTCGICYLPFGKDVRIIGLSAQYDLAAHFLDTLTAALAGRHCNQILLTNALTDETIGVWIPEGNLCYLTEAPADIREKQLALSRYLLPHTAPLRRVCRHLFAAHDLWEAYLIEILSDYRALAKEEEAFYSPLYTASRLQNFRKRLLIDLFCKSN